MAKFSQDGHFFAASLFERLHTEASSPSVTQGVDFNDVLTSIKANVARILNARAGESLSAPELGLVDFNDAVMGSRDLATRIRRSIYHCLDKYEPRISEIEIEMHPDPLSLLGIRFHLIALVEAGSLYQKVKLDLVLDNNKQYRVS
jgi:type VI secretion system protein